VVESASAATRGTEIAEPISVARQVAGLVARAPAARQGRTRASPGTEIAEPIPVVRTSRSGGGGGSSRRDESGSSPAAQDLSEPAGPDGEDQEHVESLGVVAAGGHVLVEESADDGHVEVEAQGGGAEGFG